MFKRPSSTRTTFCYEGLKGHEVCSSWEHSLGLSLLGDIPNGGTFLPYNGSHKLGGDQQAQRQVTGFLLGHGAWGGLPGGAPLAEATATSRLLCRVQWGSRFIGDVGHFQSEVFQLESIQLV